MRDNAPSAEEHSNGMEREKAGKIRIKEKERISFSVHVIADFYSPRCIDDPKELRRVLYEAARVAHNTPLRSAIYKFPGQGITGVILLAESHIALHSWPEFNYMAVDIFTCGRQTRPVLALKYLRGIFSPGKVKIRHIRRGLL